MSAKKKCNRWKRDLNSFYIGIIVKLVVKWRCYVIIFMLYTHCHSKNAWMMFNILSEKKYILQSINSIWPLVFRIKRVTSDLNLKLNISKFSLAFKIYRLINFFSLLVLKFLWQRLFRVFCFLRIWCNPCWSIECIRCLKWFLWNPDSLINLRRRQGSADCNSWCRSPGRRTRGQRRRSHWPCRRRLPDWTQSWTSRDIAWLASSELRKSCSPPRWCTHRDSFVRRASRDTTHWRFRRCCLLSTHSSD